MTNFAILINKFIIFLHMCLTIIQYKILYILNISKLSISAPSTSSQEIRYNSYGRGLIPFFPSLYIQKVCSIKE